MKVSELLKLLGRADPEARVMFMPADEDEQDAQEVRDICASDVGWTRESGVDKGRPFEFLYPGEPHRDYRSDCEQITYRSVSVIFLTVDESDHRL